MSQLARRTSSLLAVVSLVVLAACASEPEESAEPEPEAPAAPATAGTDEPAETDDVATESEELPDDPVALADSDAPERNEVLAELAAEAGTPVSLYTTLSLDDVEPVVAAFTERHGIQVDIYRALAPDVTARAVNELTAGRPGFDVVWANGQAATNLEQEDAFTSFTTSHGDGIPEDLITSELWMPTDVNYWSWAYNPNLLAEEELPRSYTDLTDQQWMSEISLARYIDWFATVWTEMGDAEAESFFSGLAANDPFITRPSFTLAQQFVSTGELPLTISTTSSLANRESESGAPIQGFFPEGPTVARPNAAGWNAEGPAPAAGLLFSDFLLDPTGAQQVLSEIGRIPVHDDVEVNPPSLRAEEFVVVDFESFTAEQEMWDQRWEQFFGSEVFEG